MMARYQVAVLDDYQGAAVSKFSSLDASQFQVTHLRDTLPAYSHPDTPQDAKDELVKRLQPYHIISTMRERTPFPEDLVRQLPNLRLLLTTGERNAALHLPSFQSMSVPVAGTRNTRTSLGTQGADTDSTTQHCVTLILALARNIAADDANVKAGKWQTDFAIGLAGKTLGIVGLGRLGLSVARIMHLAFGMKILAWSTNLTQEAADEKAKDCGLPVQDEGGNKTFQVVSKKDLFKKSDVVTLQLVLSDRSRGTITKSDLELMRPSALFVNTSRGPLVVESDLLEVLQVGKIAGAALDVFDVEPLPKDSPWRTQHWGRGGRSRVLLTPHMGYVQEDSLGRWYEQQVANIKRWVKGESLECLLI